MRAVSPQGPLIESLDVSDDIRVRCHDRTEAGLRALEGATSGEYVLNWSDVFGREDPETFVGNILTAVEAKLQAKARLSRRVDRRKGRPVRFWG